MVLHGLMKKVSKSNLYVLKPDIKFFTIFDHTNNIKITHHV